MKVLLDLFAGRLGWSKAFLARGWKVVAVDLTPPPEIPENVSFWKLDVLELHIYGGELWYHQEHYPLPDFIVASSPCEQFSVHGMKHFHPNPKYPELGIKLFNHTRSLCEASGVPYVMENVRAAQQFVGQAVHHCGPFYLWGNAVPPLINQGIGKGMNLCMARDKATGKRILAGGRRFSSGSKERANETAMLATIPPELANCVAAFAERLIEQRDQSRKTESLPGYL